MMFNLHAVILNPFLDSLSHGAPLLALGYVQALCSSTIPGSTPAYTGALTENLEKLAVG